MEQKLEDNNNKISELKKGLKKQEKINELRIKENNELKNEIEKLTKSSIKFSRLPTLFQDIEKKDNKAKTFAPADIDEKNESLNINLSYVNSLFNTMTKHIEKKNNIIDIGDNKSIKFSDIIDFSKDIIDGKINNFIKKKYNEKFK